jgi:prefoldin subunit 5
MIVELRDEYVEKERDDILAQIDQRLDDLTNLRAELRERIEQARSEA